MSKASSFTRLSHRAFGVLIGLLLVAAQLPAGSHRPWAVQLLGGAVLLLGVLALTLRFTGHLRPVSLDRLQRAALLLWLLWLAWLLIQWLPLPMSGLQRIAPASASAWQKVADLKLWPIQPRISLSPQDTLWMAWLSALYGLLYLLVLLTVRSRSSRRLLLYILVVGAVAQAAFGTLMVASGLELGPFGHKLDYLGSATGTFINRNHFAGSLEIGAGIATALILARVPQATRGYGWRRVALQFLDSLMNRSALLRVFLLVIAVGLVASRSRMGITSFLTVMTVGSITFLLYRGRGMRLRGLLFIASVILFDVFVVGGNFGLDELVQRFQAQQISGDQRVSTFNDLARMIGQYWSVGSGLGSFAYVYPPFRSPDVFAFNDHAHNDYAEFLIETGVPGVALLGLLALCSLARALSVLRHRRDIDAVGVALAGLLACASLALHSLTDFNLQIPANAATIVALLALMLGVSPRGRSRPAPSAAANPEAAPAAASRTDSRDR